MNKYCIGYKLSEDDTEENMFYFFTLANSFYHAAKNAYLYGKKCEYDIVSITVDNEYPGSYMVVPTTADPAGRSGR